MSNITILLVDDHELVRTGLKALLDKEPDMKIVGEASSGEQALKLAREKKPDVVLMDIKMPGIGGLEATRRLVRSLPHIRVIAVSSYDEDPYPARLIQTGALGFLAKDCPPSELIEAIRKVHSGQRYVSAKIAQELAIRSVVRSSEDEGSGDASLIKPLSERELQVLIMISSGLRVQEIAEKLCITPKTVNTYRYRLFSKLNVNSDVELTHVAIRHGLVDVDKSEEAQ
jgi:two-component system invasion response regulator UvrY